MDQKKIGFLIKKIRLDNNLTQKEFADKYNVSFQAVSKWEQNLALPDTNNLILISKIFNVKIDELINYNNNLSDQNINVDINNNDKIDNKESKLDANTIKENENIKCVRLYSTIFATWSSNWKMGKFLQWRSSWTDNILINSASSTSSTVYN